MASTSPNDITKAISEAVLKMAAKAATKKLNGYLFIVDEDEGNFSNYIKQHIDLVLPDESSTTNSMYKRIRVVCNGTTKTIAVPISYSTSSEHSEKHSDETETSLQHNASMGAKVGGGDGEGGSLATGAEGSIEGSASVTSEKKTKKSNESSEKNRHELRVGETELAGGTKAEYIPQGERIMNVKVKLRALGNVKLKVYHKSSGLDGDAVKGKGYAVGFLPLPLFGFLGGILGAADGAWKGRDPVTLTATEIFKEGDEFAEDEKKEGHITCVIEYPYGYAPPIQALANPT